MAATRILSWVVMMISLHIQVDAAFWTTRDSASRMPPTTEGTRPPTTVAPTTYLIIDDILLRLSDGPNSCAGNVELYYFGSWGKVCGARWDMQDAEVVCRQLGCGSAISAVHYFPSSGWSDYVMTEVDCQGYESYLWQCPYSSQYVCHHRDASVICSDSGISGTAVPPGFRSTSPPPWSTVTPPCGGLLRGLSGSFQSPGYPNSYPNNAYCVWLIQPWESKRRIELQFTDVQLEGTSCSYDAIEVYDGGSTQGWRLGSVCRNGSHVFYSSGNQLTVLFRSDHSITSRGFQAYYSSFPAFTSTMAPNIPNWTTSPSSVSEDDSCGRLLSSSSGTFESPFYPSNYPNNANCVWEIQVKNNFLVTLVFEDIQMEGGRCLSDYVEIYDGPLHTSPLLGRICSGYYRTYKSSSNMLTVRFHSNSRYTYRGFRARYYSTPADDSTTLLCLPDYMHAVVSRNFLQSHGYSAWNLTLNDPFCTPNITSEYVTFNIPYRDCGTIREGNNNTISYSNIIRGSSSGPLASRNRNLRLRVNCKMLQNTWAQMMYVADDDLEVNETQYGRYDVNLTFYDSPDFSRPVYDSPYYVNSNQSLFVQAYLHSSDPNLMLFLDTCVASPTSHNTTGGYAIIKNGCVRDPTYVPYYSPRSHIFRFKYNAFRSLQSNPVVYLQCELVVCRTYDYSSRCYQGCVRRSKREANSGLESVIVVAGPIQLWDPSSEIRNDQGSE